MPAHEDRRGVGHPGGAVLRRARGANAIIQAAKLGVSIDGATLYCTHQPCVLCAKMIVNSGITRVVYGEGYPDDFSMEIFREAGVEVVKYDENA